MTDAWQRGAGPARAARGRTCLRSVITTPVAFSCASQTALLSAYAACWRKSREGGQQVSAGGGRQLCAARACTAAARVAATQLTQRSKPKSRSHSAGRPLQALPDNHPASSPHTLAASSLASATSASATFSLAS